MISSNDIKLIITDLEGTLLHDSKYITDYTKNIIELCKKKNILIGFITTLSLNSIKIYIDLIKPDIVISNNGAVITYNNEIIYKELIDSKTTKEIIKMCKKYTNNKGKINIETEDGFYINYETDKRKKRYSNAIYNNFNNFNKPAFKITAELENDDWSKEIIINLNNCSTYNFKGEIWRKFSRQDVNKLNAIKYIEKFLYLNNNNIIVFSDNYNDIEIIKYCGIGIAMKNAVDIVKENANYITDTNNEDGVATFIKNNILKRNR